MIFYQSETLSGLAMASLPALASLYFYYIREDKKTGLALLILSAFLLRLLMISVDAYVQDWDERFHVLVAKNMMEYPLKPMLYKEHIFAVHPEDWSMMHIWVHKQPLFMWQMALSMKIFGVSTFAFRLPSAIMGGIMVFLTYDIARRWIRIDHVAFLAAFLSAFAYYILELTAGWMSLEHNDMAFLFYMTCCFWAFTRYIHSEHQTKWSILTGVFAGLAILNKWLVGLLIFGGWGLYLLLSLPRFEIKKYYHLGLAVLVACIIFMPWQIYIQHAFPVESAIAYGHNKRHMTGDLGHPGNAFFHLKFLPVAYNFWLIIFLVIGLIRLFVANNMDKKLTISFVAMIVVVFAFFSLFVLTKMPALVYPVASLMFIIMAYGLYSAGQWLFNYWGLTPERRKIMLVVLTCIAGLLSLKPGAIGSQRSDTNQLRNNKIHNSAIYRNLDENITKNYVIINTRRHENIELMFYKDAFAYHFYPTESTLDSLQALGYKFAAFDYPKDDNQALPDYIANDSEVLILNQSPK